MEKIEVRIFVSGIRWLTRASSFEIWLRKVLHYKFHPFNSCPTGIIPYFFFKNNFKFKIFEYTEKILLPFSFRRCNLIYWNSINSFCISKARVVACYSCIQPLVLMPRSYFYQSNIVIRVLFADADPWYQCCRRYQCCPYYQCCHHYQYFPQHSRFEGIILFGLTG
jgi:hypothetical protein